jgi:LmbE family N-acetylglucosaminyl deacetylase
MPVLVLLLASIPIALGGLVTLWVLATRRPRTLVDPSRDVFIAAAHPDDCVILAGAYALRALADGRRVEVCYFTNGATLGDAERAAKRTEEARVAWRTAGLGNDALEFFGLPEQGPSDPESRAAEDLDRVRTRLHARLDALAPGTAVFVPAAGESHVDHRVLRRLLLEAWRDSGRRDLVVYECAEYNDYLSFVQAPHKSLRAIVEAVPFVGPLVRSRGGTAWTGFIAGPPPWQLAPDTARARTRGELLRAFASEDGELLVQLFGGYERYRPVADPAVALATDEPRGYVEMNGRFWSASALFVLAVVLDVLGLAAASLGHGAVGLAGGGTGAVLAALAVSGAIALAGLRRGMAREARLVHAAVALGIAAGAVLAAA